VFGRETALKVAFVLCVPKGKEGATAVWPSFELVPPLASLGYKNINGIRR